MTLVRSAGAGCPICGANHASCGPTGTGSPVDIPLRKERAVGSPVRKYKVVKDGYETTLKLNDTDVKLYPDAELVDGQDTKADADDDVKPAAKTRTPADKTRRSAGDK